MSFYASPFSALFNRNFYKSNLTARRNVASNSTTSNQRESWMKEVLIKTLQFYR